jgi:hypothetical protein
MHVFGDWSEAFDLCREIDRPISVRVRTENGIEEARVYPSGRYQPKRTPKEKDKERAGLEKPDSDLSGVAALQ